jgi:hypothetical protein
MLKQARAIAGIRFGIDSFAALEAATYAGSPAALDLSPCVPVKRRPGEYEEQNLL